MSFLKICSSFTGSWKLASRVTRWTPEIRPVFTMLLSGFKICEVADRNSKYTLLFIMSIFTFYTFITHLAMSVAVSLHTNDTVKMGLRKKL